MHEMSDDKAREELAYLEEWLRRFAVTRDLAPDVQRRYKATQLNVETLDYLKSRVPDEVTRALAQDQARETAELMQRLPLIPKYEEHTALFLTMGSASTSTGIMEALSHTIEAESPPNPQGILIFVAHERLHQEHNQFAEAELLLERVFPLAPALVNLFRAAKSSYQMTKTGFGDKSHAAGDMRNFLYKFNGELLDRAREHERENMTWPTMAARFVPPVASVQHARLVEQERVHNDLRRELSPATKGRWDISDSLLSALWLRFVNHVVVVCGSILDSTPP